MACLEDPRVRGNRAYVVILILARVITRLGDLSGSRADLQRCLDIYLDHLGRRAVFEMEYRLRRHDGAWRWISDRGTPMFGPDGAFGGFIGSCTDITDRVEAQEALAAAQATRIRTLQGLLPICMYCKKIKNDDGYWEVLEKYVRDNSEADFSHGLCPDCFPTYVARLQEEADRLLGQ
ncbi:MAG: PAS domain-containing protein [Holophaga sp.]|nr:PAS domain-containing protein [Holophaga sp.]